MAYRTIDDNDTIQIRRVQGGNKPEERTAAELNEYFSKEENTEIDTLQAQVGDYDPDTTESTITDDLEQLQADVQATETGLLDRTAALEAIVHTAASGTPVAPVAASAVLTISGTLADGDDVIVNNMTYTFKTALSTPTVPNEILIGIDADASVTNLAAAINGDGTVGTDYSIGTGKPTDVTAVADTEANTVTCTATTAGVAGNSYKKFSTGENLGWDGENQSFTKGVDGTVGAAGALRFDSSKLYVSVDESTTAVSNWKYIALT